MLLPDVNSRSYTCPDLSFGQLHRATSDSAFSGTPVCAGCGQRLEIYDAWSLKGYTTELTIIEEPW